MPCCHAAMLSSSNLNSTQGQRNAARLRSSFGGPAGAFVTAIPGGCMTLGNAMFVVSVWHRLGHHVPADVAPPPCKCSAGVAAEALAIVREEVAKMTQMRHDNLATPCAWSLRAAANRRQSLATGSLPARRA